MAATMAVVAEPKALVVQAALVNVTTPPPHPTRCHCSGLPRPHRREHIMNIAIISSAILFSVLLWLGCFGLRRATMNSRAMEADLKRVFEGFKN